MSENKAVILAAGKGTRMKSDLPKVIHTVLGKTMVQYVIDAALEAGADEICLVVGHGAELVKEAVGNQAVYVEQKEQLGTGHAVKCAKEFIGTEGTVLVLCGDTPLITGKTLLAMMKEHKTSGSKATVLTAILPDATGYGRIVRNEQGNVMGIVEQKDATDEQQKIREINSGMYLFDAKALSESLEKLNNNNAQNEYYLTDTLELIRKAYGEQAIAAFVTEQADEIIGVNSREQLADVENLMKMREQ